MRYVTVSGSHFFPLSADVVANQAFIVAATALSLQRQSEAMTAVLPAAPPVQTLPSAASTSTSAPSKNLFHAGGTFDCEGEEQG